MMQSYSKRNIILICLVLVLVTLVAYEPLRHNDLVNYDDARYIIKNPHIKKGIGWDSVVWALGSSYATHWHPVTWMSHMLDYQLFGLKPLGHHLMNLLFHIVNSLLLFLVLKSMTKAIWASAFVAAAFALHPLHVESVAWASERKDVLSTFFWLLTMAAYVRYARGPSIGKYILVVLIYVFGLMSKPMLVTLPFVLLLMDGWPLGRIQKTQRNHDTNLTESQIPGQVFAGASVWRLILEKIPLLCLAVGSCMVTYFAMQHGGAVASVGSLSIKFRIANALVSYVEYIYKMVYPRDLTVLYPLAVKLISKEQLIFCLLQLAAVSVVAVCLFRRRSYLAVGWLWYLGTLVPVIGLMQVGLQSMADRYTYVPLIGIFIMVVWGGAEILAKWRFRRIGVGILVSVIFIAMIIGTRKQVRYWQNGVTLFGHTVEVTQNNYVAHNNLGFSYSNLDRHLEAIGAFKEAIRINRNYVKAYNNMGFSLGQLGRHYEAIGCFKKSIGIMPGSPEAHFNLGKSYSEVGNYVEAIAACKEAISIQPDYAEAYYNLGIAYERLGNFQEAIDAFKDTIGINPEHARAYNNLGIAYDKLGRHREAIKFFKQAIGIKRDYADAYYNLGIAYDNLGGYREAVESFKQAIGINPEHGEAYYYLGIVYDKLGGQREAIESFKQAIGINPEHGEAYNDLGIAYDKLGRHQEAIEFFKQAIGIKGDYADAYSNLGVAYFKLSRHQEAIDAFKQAIRTNPDFINAYLNLGVIYHQLRRYEDEIDTYKQIILIRPNSVAAHYNLAFAYLAIGDKNSALNEHKILKSLDKEKANVLFDIINNN